MGQRERDAWDSGYTLTVSASLKSGMLDAMDKFAAEHNLRGYTAIIRKLVRYGLIYDKILAEESLQKLRAKEEAKTTKAKAKKKAKPKTPSK